MFKKMVCVAMAVVMLLLVGCGESASASKSEGDSASESSSTVVIEEVDILEDCTLSDEQMAQVVEDYFAVLQAVMTNSGDAVEFKIDQNKDGYDVYAVRDGETPETPSLSWDNAREAFRFLYTHGQVDLEGHLLVTEDAMLDEGSVE